MAEDTKEDGILDITNDDLAELKAALYQGLEELQSFIEGKEKTTTDGKHAAFERQGDEN
ncbi:MAG: hypothetical protein SWE60_05860 [Thermodesulfobacteriota bacterium]|nr:hypothetical protein [Thermodesulfobacteriota bacterium]